ncbi:MAG: hypothetical protein D6679_03780 [Candidatus Hydrogenedentota bacterium]|nr:MAG: hypothetical protein D6679_03780 [Candidatus Hydrogenedentota bacterium]
MAGWWAWPLDPHFVGDKISSETGLPVTVRKAGFSFFRGLILEDVGTGLSSEFFDSEPFFHGKRIVFRAHLRHLLSGEFRPRSVLLDGGQLRLVEITSHGQRLWNVSYVLQNAVGAASGPLPEEFRARNIQIEILPAEKIFIPRTLVCRTFLLQPEEERFSIEILLPSRSGLLSFEWEGTEKRAEVDAAISRPLEGNLGGLRYHFDAARLSGSLEPVSLPLASLLRNLSSEPEELFRLFRKTRLRLDLQGAGIARGSEKLVVIPSLRVGTLALSSDGDTWTLAVSGIRVAERTAESPAAATGTIRLFGRDTVVFFGNTEWDLEVGTISRFFPGLVPTRLASLLKILQPGGRATIAARFRRTPSFRWNASAEVACRGISLHLPPLPALPRPWWGTAVTGINGTIEFDSETARTNSLRFEWAHAPGVLAGSVWLDAPEQKYDLVLSSAQLDAALLSPFLPEGFTARGTLQAKAEIHNGAMTAMLFPNRFLLRHRSWGQVEFRSGSVIANPDGSLRIRALVAEQERGRLRLAGVVEPSDDSAPRRIALTAELENFPARPIRGLFNAATPSDLPVLIQQGRVSGRVLVRNTTDSPTLSGEVRFQKALLTISGHKVRRASLKTSLSNNFLSRLECAGSVGDHGAFSLVGRRSRKFEDWSLDFEDFPTEILNPFLRHLEQPLQTQGPARAQVHLTSDQNGVRAQGTVRFAGNRLSFNDKLVLEETQGDLSFSPDSISFRSLSGKTRDGSITLDGTIPLKDELRYSLSLKTDAFRLDGLKPFLPPKMLLSGTIRNLSARISGTAGAPNADGFCAVENLSFRLPSWPVPLRKLSGELAFSPDSFAADHLTGLLGSGAFRIDGSLTSRPVFAAENLVVEAQSLQLAHLLPLLPDTFHVFPAGTKIAGRLSLDDFTADGVFPRIRFAGTARLEQGAMAIKGLNYGVEDLHGRLAFSGDSLLVRELSGTIGRSPLHLEGDIRLVPPFAVTMNLAGQGIELRDLYDAVARPDSSDPLRLSGTATPIAKVTYDGRLLKAEGTITEGNLSSFGMPFENVTGRFTYLWPGSRLVLEDLESKWAGGKATEGRILLNFSSTPVRIYVSGMIERARLERILELNGIAPRKYRGSVDGEFEIEGPLVDTTTLTGTGHFVIRNGLFPDLAPLERLSRILRFDPFSRSTYQTVTADFSLKNGVLRTTPPAHITFRGHKFLLRARGTTNLNGKIHYDYVAVVPEGVLGKVLNVTRLGRLFSLEPGKKKTVKTAGRIIGTLTKPRVEPDLGILNTFR